MDLTPYGLVVDHQTRCPVATPQLDRLAQLHRLTSIRTEPFRPVLCHTDFSGDNLLATADGIVVLDWDEAVIGPAEVDVMVLAEHEPDRRSRLIITGSRVHSGQAVADLSEVAPLLLAMP